MSRWLRASEPIDVATYYRRRCEPSKYRLSIWGPSVRLNGETVKWIEDAADPSCDKAPKEFRVKLHTRPGGINTYRVVLVPADAVLLVAATDPGLREVC